MKKVFTLFLFVTLISCTSKEYSFDFNGKWILLRTEYNGKEIRDEFIHSPFLSFTNGNKKVFPAIQFSPSDSTVMVPGEKIKKEKLLFSVDKNMKNIQFIKKEKTDKKSLIDKLFIHNFKVEKNIKVGTLTLKSDSTIIYMMPAEIFAYHKKARELD